LPFESDAVSFRDVRKKIGLCGLPATVNCLVSGGGKERECVTEVHDAAVIGAGTENGREIIKEDADARVRAETPSRLEEKIRCCAPSPSVIVKL
jgi:hypothetical protein